MRSMRYFLAVSALTCVPQMAESQTVTPPSFITGFELGSVAEAFGSLNGGIVQSAVKRSGDYAYRANPIYSNARITFASRTAGGFGRQIFKSSRFYVQIAALPTVGSVSIVKIGGAATYNPEIDLNSDGTLTLADSWYPSIARSSNALSADGLWHRVEFDVGNGLRVYVNGELWASGGSTSYPAGVAISFGAGEAPTYINATCDLYFDDIRVDAGSYAGGLPGDGHALLLKPASDPLNLNSWTGGAGSTASVYMGVRNVPAEGQPKASAGDTTQAKNGSNHSNQDYKPAVQTYLEAGVPSGATINAVMAIASDGQESSKGSAKTGMLWIDSNPAQGSGYSFDFGDASGVTGAFPSGWASHFGPVGSGAGVNLGSSPVVAVRKSSGSNVDVDFLGVYVDYQ